MKFQAIKGVRDILPPESALWNRVEQTAREVFATYGYGEIRLPVFEQTELFARSIGVETDVVSKEMYTFEDFQFSNLMELWTATITWDLPNASTADFQYFHELVARFLAKAKQAFDDGDIPKTPENKMTLENLGHVRVLLQSVLNQARQDVLPRVAAVKEEVRKVRFGDSLTLRPEATASVCRAYIEHGMQTLPGNVKLYYIGPMFRRERPQKGRYRQFYQIGAEVLTPAQKEETEKERRSDAAIDAEVIEMLVAFFERVGLGGRKLEVGGRKSESETPTSDLGPQTSGVTLYINSIGCKECRPKYVAVLKAALEKVRDKLGADSQRRIETNPLRVLDSKLPEEQALIETLPRISEHLCEACRTHYAEVKQQLAVRGVAYEENWRLVRGLDYYMRTTFEITAPGLGSQNAVCGGGRYDGLVELLGGPATKGIGFAIGTDRLILSLQATESKDAGKMPAVQGLDVFIAWMGAAAQPVGVKIARAMREAGISVEVPAEEMKFKKSIGLADKLGARFALIIGENELKEGKFALKRLTDGFQEMVTEAELLSKVASGE